MGPPSYVQSVIDRNVVMRSMTVNDQQLTLVLNIVSLI